MAIIHKDASGILEALCVVHLGEASSWTELSGKCVTSQAWRLLLNRLKQGLARTQGSRATREEINGHRGLRGEQKGEGICRISKRCLLLGFNPSSSKSGLPTSERRKTSRESIPL